MDTTDYAGGRCCRLTIRCILVLVVLCSLRDGGQAQAVKIPHTKETNKARLIVLTDIGAEVDDTESLVRLMLYSDVIDIKGLIATTSTWKRASVSPNLIREVIHAYAQVQGNLTKHDPDFPAASTLEAVVHSGCAEYGMSGVGPGKDSEGSDWIIRTLAEDDPRPLWIAVWGGANTLGQALYRLRTTQSPTMLARSLAKLRVYAISDQDDSGPWIRNSFPEIFYIVSPGGDYSKATWRGINLPIEGIDNSTISNGWLAEHIQQGHGPLGAAYPDVAYSMEGDTPSWLGLIPNGLNDPEHPDWGGWGGRYELYRPTIPVSDPKTFIGGVPISQETRAIWTDAKDIYVPHLSGEYGRATRSSSKPFSDFGVSIWKWRDDFQNDFAARMAWTTMPFEKANHPPSVFLDGPANITVRSEQEFTLSAHGSDPDGDSLSFFWFVNTEGGSSDNPVRIDAADNMDHVSLIAPKVGKAQRYQVVLRLTDKGEPRLSRYTRVLVTVLP